MEVSNKNSKKLLKKLLNKIVHYHYKNISLNTQKKVGLKKGMKTQLNRLQINHFLKQRFLKMGMEVTMMEEVEEVEPAPETLLFFLKQIPLIMMIIIIVN